MPATAIVDIVRQYLMAVANAGIPVDGGVLFGSCARGDQRVDSDIDLVVLSPRFDEAKTAEDLDLLWRLRRKTDWRIEPIAAGVHEFAEDSSSPILAAARHEGLVVRL